MYGDGATASAIEHRFRSIRRMAEELRNTATSGNPTTPVTLQPRSRVIRSIFADYTTSPRTPRSGEKRSNKGNTSKKSAKSTGDPKTPIAIEDSDGDDEDTKSPIKKAKRETASPTPYSQLLDPETGNPSLVDSRANGYELSPMATFSNVPKLEEPEDLHDMMSSDHVYGYFDEA